MDLNILDLGLTEYGECLKLQTKIREMRNQNKIIDTLILTEHHPVLTLGCRGDESNILADQNTINDLGIRIYHTKRGGDVTYHGPGQLVGYPIINLKNSSLNIKEYIDKLQEVFIELLNNEYGIKAHKELKEYTGVWIGKEKITAIGIQISHMVTMHGFAYNINTNLDHFKLINPCGLTDRTPTSLEKLTGNRIDMHLAKSQVVYYFAKIFGANLINMDTREIENV